MNMLVTELSNPENQVYGTCINRLAMEFQLHCHRKLATNKWWGSTDKLRLGYGISCGLS